jgi:hypothetical protein
MTHRHVALLPVFGPLALAAVLKTQDVCDAVHHRSLLRITGRKCQRGGCVGGGLELAQDPPGPRLSVGERHEVVPLLPQQVASAPTTGQTSQPAQMMSVSAAGGGAT